jgi:thioredoxin reductase (NADPH)
MAQHKSDAAARPDAAVFNPTDPYVRQAQTFPTLTDEQIARIAAFGIEEELPRGTVLFERGERTVDFFVITEGCVEIYDHHASGPRVMTVHARNQFTGELDLFNNRDILVGGRMGVDGRVIRLSRPQFRRLLAAEPDLSEIIMRAFILRRIGFIEHEEGAVTLIGSRRSADTLRIQRFLSRNGHPVRLLDPESADAREMLAANAVTADDLPVVIRAGDPPLNRPSNCEVGSFLGISERIDPTELFDVVVVGAGPGGLASAVYAASEGLNTVVLEAEAPGGQAGTSSKIENYLGFPTGISGQHLAGRAQIQAQKFGARIAVPQRVVKLECERRPYGLQLDDGSVVRARAVVVATGASYRKLEVENLDRYEGAGIHYAATAIEAGLCEREEIIVVGGGNSAGQAAVFLSRYASHVHMLIRGTGLAASMSDYLIGRIDASERITLHTQTEITALLGERLLEQVRWRNRATGREETRKIGNVFLMLGAVPNTEWLHGCIALDEHGFIRCGGEFECDAALKPDRVAYPLETSRPGIFAVGDVRAGSIKRVASAVGEGSIVVSAVHQTLAEVER